MKSNITKMHGQQHIKISKNMSFTSHCIGTYGGYAHVCVFIPWGFPLEFDFSSFHHKRLF